MFRSVLFAIISQQTPCRKKDEQQLKEQLIMKQKGSTERSGMGRGRGRGGGGRGQGGGGRGRGGGASECHGESTGLQLLLVFITPPCHSEGRQQPYDRLHQQ